MCSANDVRENREKRQRSGLLFHSTSDVRWLPFLPVVLGLPDISARCRCLRLNETPIVRLAEFFVTAQSRKALNLEFAKKCRVFPSLCRIQGAVVCNTLIDRCQAQISNESYNAQPTGISCIQRISLTTLEPRSPKFPLCVL